MKGDHYFWIKPPLFCLFRCMRPAFFSKYEWWYHLGMMPVLLAMGNYYFIGLSYFSHLPTFVTGTALVFFLYWFSILALTRVIRWVIARFPEAGQTVKRLAVMLLLVGGLTVFLAIFDVWAYSITPGLQVLFSWNAIWPILVLGAFFDIFLCVALGLFYSLEKWKQNQTETERLERLALQHQFNILKGQVNPHFLFNSLNTLSSLIGEDTSMAENFVEDLAKIYRYMLQAGKVDTVYLSSELEFLHVYTRLLHIRYGASLIVGQPPDTSYTDMVILPLAVQTLVDNAIKHNVMTAGRPLKIDVEVIPEKGVRVQNNIQRKNRTLEPQTSGRLSSLVSKYMIVANSEVGIHETSTHFSVMLPLIHE
jgi:sensor histidine kinase YesM